MIPSIERERLIEAFEEFDKTLRDTLEWQGWQTTVHRSGPLITRVGIIHQKKSSQWLLGKL